MPFFLLRRDIMSLGNLIWDILSTGIDDLVIAFTLFSVFGLIRSMLFKGV